MSPFEPGIHVRKPVEGDADSLARLISRFYMFNEEFDRAWALAPDYEERARESAERCIKCEDCICLVGVYNERVVGYVRAVVRENKMLASGRMGFIEELYVVPEERKSGVGRMLVREVLREMARLNVRMLAASFPEANFVAESFYRKLGFRRYMSVYLMEVG